MASGHRCDPRRCTAGTTAAAAPTRHRVLPAVVAVVAAVAAAVAATATLPASTDGCFPGYATAQLPSGVAVRLDALPADAEVRVSTGTWAPLLGMNTTDGSGGSGRPHTSGRDTDDGGGKPTGRPHPLTAYVRLTMPSAELDLTPTHLVPVYGRAGEPPVSLQGRPTAIAAGVVGVGDRLAVVAATSPLTGRRGPAVEAVQTVAMVMAPAGRYAPVTAAGTVVVGGVVVTTTTTTTTTGTPLVRWRPVLAAGLLPAAALLAGAVAAATAVVAATNVATATVATAATAATAAIAVDGGLPAPTVHNAIRRLGAWQVGWSGVAMPGPRLATEIAFPNALNLTLGRSLEAVVPVGDGKRRVQLVFRPFNATLTVAVTPPTPHARKQSGEQSWLLPTDYVGRTDVVVVAATPAKAFGGHGAPSVKGARLTFLALPYSRTHDGRDRRNVPGASTLMVGVQLPRIGQQHPRLAMWAASLAVTAADNAALAVGGAPCDGRFESISGVCNARGHGPWRGTAGTPLKRRDPKVDGVWPAGESMAFRCRPNCRRVSNAVAAQAVGKSIPSAAGLTDLWTFWGQFIDHDMALTASSGGSAMEEAVPIPLVDPADPLRTGGRNTLAFARSFPMSYTAGASHHHGPSARKSALAGRRRETANLATAFLDGSHIYGDEWERVEVLRAHWGGRLRVGGGAGHATCGAGRHGCRRARCGCPGRDVPEPLLPNNDASSLNGSVLPNEPSENATFFAAGDRRANVQPGLTALHTLFVREHNRVAGVLARAFPCWDDERLYQEARQLVVATTQAITYNEWLPHALGPSPDKGGGGLDPYKGYNASVDPSMDSFFATVAFRFGHSAIPDTLAVLDAPGKPNALNGTPLAKVFFAPSWMAKAGVGRILLGAASRIGQEVDRHVVNSLRNALFAEQNGQSLDLVALNCARGRDHGSPTINAARSMYGLRPHRSFEELTGGTDREGAAALASVYRTVDDVDPFIGGLAEAHVRGGAVGGLFAASLRSQFTALRDGDRFFYRNIHWGAVLRLPLGRAVAEGRRTLRDVLVDNGGMRAEDWPDNVFKIRKA
ncbi:hypothetical protein MMPV_000477 [Pyropia vietnamensis]